MTIDGAKLEVTKFFSKIKLISNKISLKVQHNNIITSTIEKVPLYHRRLLSSPPRNLQCSPESHIPWLDPG